MIPGVAVTCIAIALACRALVCLHTDLWHEAMRGVWHESAGRAVSLHGERQRALEEALEDARTAVLRTPVQLPLMLSHEDGQAAKPKRG